MHTQFCPKNANLIGTGMSLGFLAKNAASPMLVSRRNATDSLDHQFPVLCWQEVILVQRICGSVVGDLQVHLLPVPCVAEERATGPGVAQGAPRFKAPAVIRLRPPPATHMHHHVGGDTGDQVEGSEALTQQWSPRPSASTAGEVLVGRTREFDLGAGCYHGCRSVGDPHCHTRLRKEVLGNFPNDTSEAIPATPVRTSSGTFEQG